MPFFTLFKRTSNHEKKLDDGLVQLLRDWQLESVSSALARAGVTSVKAIEEDFHYTQVAALGLRGKEEKNFYRLLEHSKALFEARIHKEEEERQRQADEERRRLEEQKRPTARLPWKWAGVALAAAGVCCTEDPRLRAGGVLALFVLAVTPAPVFEFLVLYLRNDAKGMCSRMRAECNARIRCYGCFALAGLARNTENIHAIDHEVILGALKEHKTNAGVCRYGCRALRRIAVDAHNQAKIANTNGVCLILQAMLAHTADVLTQKEGTGALLKISCNADTLSKIIAEDGVTVILTSMQKFSDCSDLQQSGCEVIRHLAVNADYKQRIVEAQGIEILVASLRTHLGDPGVVMQSCWGLRRLAFHPDDNQKKSADADFLAAILEAMNLRAKNLQSEMGATQQDNKKRISDHGAISVIIDAMRANEAHAGVQEQGCAVLENLAHDNSNKAKIAEAGGIPVILVAMRAHTTHTGVQEQGCWALRNLAVNPINKQTIADSASISNVVKGGIIKTRAIKETIPGIGLIGRLAAALLHWLARTLLVMACHVGGTFAGQVMNSFSTGNVSRAQLDGVTVLLEAMRAHATSTSIQIPACGAIWNLAYNADENKKKIAEAGTISVLLEAIRSHPSNPGVQERACGALGCIGWSDKVLQRRIKEAGAERVLKLALDAQGATPVSIDRCQLLLDKLRTIS